MHVSMKRLSLFLMGAVLSCYWLAFIYHRLALQREKASQPYVSNGLLMHSDV